MAQHKTIKQLFEEVSQVVQQLQNALYRYAKDPHPYTQKEIDTFISKRDWYLNQIEYFGRGKIIEVSGLVKVKNKRNSTLITLKPFKYYLINCSIEDVTIYFENIVKKKYLIDPERTLNFKELKTGILLIS